MVLSSVLLVSKLWLDQEGDGALFCVVGFKTMARPGGGWRSCAPKSRQTSSRLCLKYTFAVYTVGQK